MRLAPIPGYEGRYSITIDGRVWSWRRERSKGGWRKISPNVHGYPQVSLGRGHVHEVHRLVALTFLGPPPPGQEVRHLDGNKMNIWVGNLAYGTRREQRLDDVRNGTSTIVAYNRTRSA